MKMIRKKRNLAALRDDRRGSAFVEAALVLPLTVIILAGISEWGLALYQYHLLSNATANSVRQLIISRGYNTPHTDVMSEYGRWAGTLNVTSDMVTVEVNGGTCTDDTSCKNRMNDALAKPASVTVAFPCTMQFIPSVASPCPITLTMTGLVE